MKAIRRMFPYLVILACLAPVATAMADSPPSTWSWQRKSKPKPPADQVRDRAPEFDPSALGAIAVLLAGGGVMFSRKRA